MTPVHSSGWMAGTWVAHSAGTLQPMADSFCTTSRFEIAPIEMLSQAAQELATEDLRERAHREEEARVPRRDPARAVGGQRTAGHHVVQMGMEREGLERLARGAEEQVVDHTGPSQGEWVQLVG